jgi:hypothetical protein
VVTAHRIHCDQRMLQAGPGLLSGGLLRGGSGLSGGLLRAGPGLLSGGLLRVGSGLSGGLRRGGSGLPGGLLRAGPGLVSGGLLRAAPRRLIGPRRRAFLGGVLPVAGQRAADQA